MGGSRSLLPLLRRGGLDSNAIDVGPMSRAAIDDITRTVGMMKNKSVLPTARWFGQLHIAGRRSTDEDAGLGGEVYGIVGGGCGADGL